MLTAIITANASYFFHMLLHKVNYKKLYKKINKCNNIYTENGIMNTILKYLCEMFDFHDKIHHDSNVNKTNKNKIVEFILNNVVISLILIILKYILENCSYYILLYWGLIYSSIHIINYDIVKEPTHAMHHIDKYTNLGPYICDIMYGTTYDDTDENVNYCAINHIITTLLFYLTFFR